jgi:hypothetical protein
LDRPRPASRCAGLDEGMGWAVRLPHKGPRTRKAAKERPWIREGRSSLLSQRLADPSASRSPGRAKGVLRAAAVIQPLRQTQKSPPEASGGHTSSSCIYCIILRLAKMSMATWFRICGHEGAARSRRQVIEAQCRHRCGSYSAAAKRKNPPKVSGGHTSSFCIYCIILQSVDGNVKGQEASDRVPRRTRCSAKTPVREANLGHGRMLARVSARIP